VLHDHGDAQAVRLLRAVRAALPSDGTLLIAEPMSGTPGAARVADVYFGFYLLAMGSGRARTPTQLARLLGAADFAAPRLHSTALPMAARLLVAHCSRGASVKSS
jgi:demethylspheroidene O-methyltransferase